MNLFFNQFSKSKLFSLDKYRSFHASLGDVVGSRQIFTLNRNNYLRKFSKPLKILSDI